MGNTYCRNFTAVMFTSDISDGCYTVHDIPVMGLIIYIQKLPDSDWLKTSATFM